MKELQTSGCQVAAASTLPSASARDLAGRHVHQRHRFGRKPLPDQVGPEEVIAAGAETDADSLVRQIARRGDAAVALRDLLVLVANLEHAGGGGDVLAAQHRNHEGHPRRQREVGLARDHQIEPQA